MTGSQVIFASPTVRRVKLRRCIQLDAIGDNSIWLTVHAECNVGIDKKYPKPKKFKKSLLP